MGWDERVTEPIGAGAPRAGAGEGPVSHPAASVHGGRPKGVPVELTSHLPPADRERVESRLRHNLMAWLTTVRPDGQPISVPVWFLLRDDETILVYSRPGKQKLRNIAANPRVSLGLDVTDLGRNIVRLEGTAAVADDVPPADRQPAYLAKYTERIGALFGTPERFAELFSVPVVITPTRLHS